ncbi:hypothetical protein AB0G79_13230 [Streptomyces sp. NPDC020807]
MSVKTRFLCVVAAAVAAFGFAAGAVTLPSASDTSVQAGTITNRP